MKNSIGGYFELELNKNKEFHENAICLNTGRNCLEYILKVNKYKKIYIPFYICDVILEPIKKIGIDYEFYKIDKEFKPIFNFTLSKEDAFLYVNYFGIKQDYIKKLSKKFKNLIIDNTQAFFDKPIKGIDTFYSARKCFGVPDGAYLYSHKKTNNTSELEQDISSNRIKHLLLRIEYGAEKGYEYFIENENSLINQPIKKMSKLTHAVLNSINYEKVMLTRKNNFIFLHNKLKNKNEITIDIKNIKTPMIYPFLYPNSNKLRKILIDNKIFIASYWKNINKLIGPDSYEIYLSNNLLPIPIDQRYSIKDMNKIINIIIKNI